MDKLFMFLFGILPSKPTGLATSVLRRSTSLDKNGVSNTILAHVYNIHHGRDMEILREKGMLTASIRYLYDDIAGETNLEDTRPIIDPLEEYKLNSVFIPDAKSKNVTRVYNNGDYELYVWMDEYNHVSWVDYLNTSFIREKRVWFDQKGYPRKIENMDFKTNKVLRTKYLDRQGYCYLTVQYKNEGKEIVQIIYFNKEDGSYKIFNSQDQLIEFWLENFIFHKEDRNLVISEYAHYWETLKKFEGKYPKFDVIYTIHNSHYDAPYTEGSPLRSDFHTIFHHLDEHQNLVVLTEEQKRDIVSEYGRSEKFHVIPHHMESSSVEGGETRNPLQLITASRFEKIKNIEDAIEAFKIVLDKFPNAIFKIFGRGEQEKVYRSLIKEYGLENNVKLMGFSTDIQKEFRESSISLFCSKYEGFCLSLAESMAEGCVPVSYDFKYGPSTIISNNVDGIICEKTPIAMAKSIVSLLKNPKKLNKMSENAKTITNKFSEKRLVTEWTTLFYNLGFKDLTVKK